jgi:hypothetical protein
MQVETDEGEIIERIAALDVGKAEVVCCARVPGPGGQRMQEVRTTSTMTAALLTSLVSTQTGQPIGQTSPTDPGGFGLGVAQLTAEPIGTFWFYEGETLGFRTLHVYLPESEVIIAIGLNSHPADDQIRSLAVSVYETLMSEGVLSAQAPVGAAA